MSEDQVMPFFPYSAFRGIWTKVSLSLDGRLLELRIVLVKSASEEEEHIATICSVEPSKEAERECRDLSNALNAICWYANMSGDPNSLCRGLSMLRHALLMIQEENRDQDKWKAIRRVIVDRPLQAVFSLLDGDAYAVVTQGEGTILCSLEDFVEQIFGGQSNM